MHLQICSKYTIAVIVDIAIAQMGGISQLIRVAGKCTAARYVGTLQAISDVQKLRESISSLLNVTIALI